VTDDSGNVTGRSGERDQRDSGNVTADSGNVTGNSGDRDLHGGHTTGTVVYAAGPMLRMAKPAGVSLLLFYAAAPNARSQDRHAQTKGRTASEI
jgi:hypothetical protein